LDNGRVDFQVCTAVLLLLSIDHVLYYAPVPYLKLEDYQLPIVESLSRDKGEMILLVAVKLTGVSLDLQCT
jgi:hypothetical protein